MNRPAEKPPVVGITTYGRDDQSRFALPAQYVDAVRRSGGLPVLLPPGEKGVARVLSLLDALILAGGGDIDPAFYGGQSHPSLYMVDRERDAMEIDLARAAVDKSMPTLAICRGSQVLNVALGGTLYEHLPEIFGDTVKHRLPPREPVPHTITADAGSRLARVLGGSRCRPSSWHHQAIRQVADPLKVVARATDNVIEALELPEHPWLLAVQWHPELTAAEDPTQQRLFDALVRAAAEMSHES